MLDHFRSLVLRDSSEQSTNNNTTYEVTTTTTESGPPPGAIPHTMVSLLIALLVLLILALLLVAALLFMRQRRRARNNVGSLLPVYDEKRLSTSSTASASHRRIMVRPSESVYVYQEKQNLLNHSDSPPPSPIPEIRITFPEEIDDSGKRKSGRVVVVRVSDSGIGLEPVEGLPAYQEDGARFQSIDLERVGGLVEKARNAPPRDQQ